MGQQLPRAQIVPHEGVRGLCAFLVANVTVIGEGVDIVILLLFPRSSVIIVVPTIKYTLSSLNMEAYCFGSHQSLGLLLLGMLRALCTLVPSGYDKIVPVERTYATTKMVVSESMDIDIGSALEQHARRHSFQAPLLIR